MNNNMKKDLVMRRCEPMSIGSDRACARRRSAQYAECQKNHAANVGGYAVDGCREFMADGEEGSSSALRCAACGCHRNFHRRVQEHNRSIDCSIRQWCRKFSRYVQLCLLLLCLSINWISNYFMHVCIDLYFDQKDVLFVFSYCKFNACKSTCWEGVLKLTWRIGEVMLDVHLTAWKEWITAWSLIRNIVMLVNQAINCERE